MEIYNLDNLQRVEMAHVEEQVEEFCAGAAVSEEWIDSVEPSHDEDSAFQRLFRLVMTRNTIKIKYSK